MYTQDGPKKSLGQHWLHDAGSLQAIVDAAQLTADDTVVEIGPGLGTLTELLIATGAKVIAVEFDEELLGFLRNKFSDAANFTLEHADILKYDFTKLPAGYKVVANIPYYLTSHLLRLLTDSSNPPAAASLLVQKEVAERVCATPPDMSILAVAVQLEYQASLGVFVPAKLFTPPPKVDSQTLVLQKHSENRLAATEKQAVMRVVKAGFSAKRKTLRNTISAGLQITKLEAEAALQKAQIEPGRRAETLSILEWFALVKIIA